MARVNNTPNKHKTCTNCTHRVKGKLKELCKPLIIGKEYCIKHRHNPYCLIKCNLDVKDCENCEHVVC